MRVSFLALILAAVGVAFGCERQPGRKVDVKAPGVEVNVDSEKGVDVKAPGVDVQTSPEGPARVKVDGDPK